MPKKMTTAAWKKMYFAYEEIYNAIAVDLAEPAEENHNAYEVQVMALYIVHRLLRERAGGGIDLG